MCHLRNLDMNYQVWYILDTTLGSLNIGLSKPTFQSTTNMLRILLIAGFCLLLKQGQLDIKWCYVTHRIIFPYSSDRMKRSRTFFILSPRVLKFCMKPPTHILIKTGVEQKLCQKVKYFSILNFVWKMLKNGKFWPKNDILVFLAHKWR